MEKKVSIIIPVYNVELYIKECIDSIIRQTYSNIEIILIDDGSTDNSGKICDEYAMKDKRIVVIHQSNSGVSEARNRGIEKSTGEYICFVDSDDLVTVNFIEKLIENSKDVDMVICGYYEKYSNNLIQHSVYKENIVLDKNNAINLLFERKYYGGYLWNKLFKANILKGIKFDTKIHMLEDLLVVVKYMLKSNNIKVINEDLYYYRMRKTSAVMGKNKEKFYSMFEAYSQIYNLLIINKITTQYFLYMLCLDLITHKEIVKELNITRKLDIEEKTIFKNIVFGKEYSGKLKIKMLTKKYFKFIFKIYMKKKRNNNVMYE